MHCSLSTKRVFIFYFVNISLKTTFLIIYLHSIDEITANYLEYLFLVQKFLKTCKITKLLNGIKHIKFCRNQYTPSIALFLIATAIVLDPIFLFLSNNHSCLKLQSLSALSMAIINQTACMLAVASQAIGERAHLIGSCSHVMTSGDYQYTIFLLIIALQ